MGFREYLIALNILAFVVIAGVIVWRVLSIRRNPEPETPRNLTEFLPDEDLEGRRLERVLGWSLVFTAVIAFALPAYFLAEPFRQDTHEDFFLADSIERGRVLFADATVEGFESDLSLQCARCHGSDGSGGVATQVLQPEADTCVKEENQNNVAVQECLSKQVSWQAPDLTLAALRYNRGQLNQIITYGRPGTPMPAWGVKSGEGSENEQAILDLVNYLESIAITPEKARADAEKAIAKYKSEAEELVATKQSDLAAAQADLAAAQAEPSTPADTIPRLELAVTTGQAELDAAIALNEEAQELSDGAVLFRLNCARCHTKGWSYFITEPVRTDIPPLAPQGSGAYGPNLTSGSTRLQFVGEAGVQEQFDWVAEGVPANDPYGARGISSGRMPHFARVLTEEQIRAIVEYERSL